MANTADKPSVSSSSIPIESNQPISENNTVASAIKLFDSSTTKDSSKIDDAVLPAAVPNDVKVVHDAVIDVVTDATNNKEQVAAVVEDIVKPAKKSLFGTIFRRGKSAAAHKPGTEEPETASPEATDLVADDKKTGVDPEPTTKEVDTPKPEVETVVEPPADAIKSPKSPKLFPFSKKKYKKSDSGPISPVDDSNGTSTSSPILPDVVTDTKSPVVPIGETPSGLDNAIKEASTAYESISESATSKKADQVKDDTSKNELKQDITTAVIDEVVVTEDAGGAAAVVDVSAEDKEKAAGLFGRFPLNRKKDAASKHEPSPTSQEVVIPDIKIDEPSQQASESVSSSSKNASVAKDASLSKGVSSKDEPVSKEVEVPKDSTPAEPNAVTTAATEEPSVEPELPPAKKEKRQSIIFGLLNSMTLRRNTSEEAPPLPTNGGIDAGSKGINVPEKDDVDAVSENEEPSGGEVSAGGANKPVATPGGSAYGPILRSSYLLKPTALTRAIHRRHFTLHQSGEIVMRMNALDMFESKVYLLTATSELFVPSNPKIDYELIVKLTDKKNISLVTGSEWEREAWAASLTDVVEKMKAATTKIDDPDAPAIDSDTAGKEDPASSA